MQPKGPLPVFPPQALLACDACAHVFINWSADGTRCASCEGTSLRSLQWPERGQGHAGARSGASA